MKITKRKTKRLLSILLTLCLILTFVPVFSQTASAATGTVAITAGMTESAIKTALEDAIDTVDDAGGGTVTVTGSKTGIVEGIKLSIPEGVTVVWKATYTGEIDTGDNYLISFTDGGIFEVATGGSLEAIIPNDGGKAIEVYGWGNVLVTGGKVSVTGDNTTAIYNNSGNVTITGGAVSASGGDCSAVVDNHGLFKVSGGIVEASGNNCTALYADVDVYVIVTGGAVSADIDGGTGACYAIFVWKGTAAVKGGTVEAIDSGGSSTDLYAIYIGDHGATAYLDGTVGAGYFAATWGWIAEVVTGWTGSVDSEITLKEDDGAHTDLEWLLDPDALYITDDNGDYNVCWDEPVYSAADVAAIENMIANNGLAYPTAPAGADDVWFHDNWPGVTWDGLYPVQRITELIVSSEGLTGTLNVSALTELEYLECYNNKLTGLVLTGLTKLQFLWCSDNKLTGLNLTGLTSLENLDCTNNNLSTLDLSDLTHLLSLFCGGNALVTLDVSDCAALIVLSCNDNLIDSLTGLPVTLEQLFCSQNKLTGFDVTGLDALEYLYCSYNYINSDELSTPGTRVLGVQAITKFPSSGWDNDEFTFSPQHAASFVAALKVIDLPETIAAGATLKLTGTVFPSDATNKIITEWVLDDDGSTGSTLTDDDLTAGTPGWLELYAVVADGAADGEDLEWWFGIEVVTASPPPTEVAFTAEQTGGTSGTVDSTGIILTFDETVSGLTAGDVTITNGTGAVTKGALSGAGDTWTIALASVTEEGNVTVSIADFGAFAVTTSPQTVAVYKNSALTTPDAPAALTLDSSDAASVTLDPIVGAEYAVNTVNNTTGLVWQDSEIFSSLTPNTTYYFFARIKAVPGVSNASAASPSLEVITAKAALSGAVTISGITQYGQTLTAVTTGLTSTPASVLGALSYQWQRGGADISGATEATYVLDEDDVSQTISVIVEAANCTGDVTSASTPAIAKAAQAAPAIVYERTVDASDDWVVEITSPATGAEYSTDGGGTYSATNPITFAASTPSATIYARLLETATHTASPASSLDIYFDKEDQGPPPSFELTYTVDTPDTSYVVTIPATEGAEYSFDGSAWSDAVNEISGCLPDTTVTGYKRYKETTEANASSVVSASFTLPLFKAQTPTATPKGGNFKTTQDVALACATTGASVYFTLDGTTPTTGSILYSAPFTLTKTTTVKAVAFLGGMADSNVLTARYTKGSSSSSSSNTSDETASYTVTFDLDGGYRTGGGALSQLVPWSASAEEPRVQREGYIFDGWDKSLSGIIVNTTITALWRPENADETETDTDEDSDAASNPDNNPDNWDNPFTDVNPNDWFYADVAYVLANGLMNGIATDLFDPDTNLTRGMIVTILYRLEGEPALSDLANIFDDVAAGQYYANAVQWAAANGLVTGYGNGLFGANDSITRQDLAVILMRYMNYKEINLAVTAQWIMFADEGDISGYAMDALQTLNKLGVINGVGTNEFGQIIVNPQANATRAQVAAMLHRFLELIK